MCIFLSSRNVLYNIMKVFNWPQASLKPVKSQAMLIQGSWWDYDLDISVLSEFPSRYGNDEVTKFMTYLTQFEIWDELDNGEHRLWGIKIEEKYLNESGGLRSNRTVDFNNDSDDYRESDEFSTQILQIIGTKLAEIWEGQWELILWHNDPDWEMLFQKMGTGMLYA